MARLPRKRSVTDHVRVGADAQAGGVHATGLESRDLLEQGLEVDHHAVADHGGDLRGQDAGREQLEFELLTMDHDRVPGVVAAVGFDHEVHAFTQQVGRLPLTLVPPLGSDDHDGRHGDS
jgi:hypothetical protein